MMRLRTVAFVLLTLFAFPEVSYAGLIQFDVKVGSLTYTEPNPNAALTLFPIPTPGSGLTFGFNTSIAAPAEAVIVGFDPSGLPAVSAGGTTHWDVNGYYSVPLTITDLASGQSATFTFFGQAHMVADFSSETGWVGSATFSSQDFLQVRIGGNLYSIWGDTYPSNSSMGMIDVWVGSGPPPTPLYTPEPGTFALAALGLVPLGLRRVRRMW